MHAPSICRPRSPSSSIFSTARSARPIASARRYSGLCENYRIGRPTMTAAAQAHSRVAIAGLGAVGLAIAKALDKGIDGLALTAISAKDKDGARRRLAKLGNAVEVVDIAELEPRADIVIECAPAELLPEITEPFPPTARTRSLLIPAHPLP